MILLSKVSLDFLQKEICCSKSCLHKKPFFPKYTFPSQYIIQFVCRSYSFFTLEDLFVYPSLLRNLIDYQLGLKRILFCLTLWFFHHENYFALLTINTLHFFSIFFYLSIYYIIHLLAYKQTSYRNDQVLTRMHIYISYFSRNYNFKMRIFNYLAIYQQYLLNI